MNHYLPRHRHMTRQPHPGIPWLLVQGSHPRLVQCRANHRCSKCLHPLVMYHHRQGK
jgi:hypothetical protein